MLWVLVLLLPAILLLGPVAYWYYVLFKHRSLNKLPGPKPVIFIGCKFQRDSKGLFNDICDLFQKYDSRFVVYNGTSVRVFHSKPEHIQAILTSKHLTKSDNYTFVKPWIGEGLITSTGAKWKARRKLITPSFHFNVLNQFMRTFNNSGDRLIKTLADDVGKPTDMYKTVNMFVFDVVCETTMGTPMNTLEGEDRRFLDGVKKFLTIMTIRFFSYWERFDILFEAFSELYNEQQNLVHYLHKFSCNIIAKRRELLTKQKEILQMESEHDLGLRKKVALMDSMLINESDDKLSTKDVREEIDTFLFAGFDTVSPALSYAFYSLAQNSDVQQKVQEEILAVVGSDTKEVTFAHLQQMQYLDRVIKEVLRMYPSVPLIERKLEEDFIMDGVLYPRGVNIALGIYWLHNNPKIFPNPEKFDPNRFLPENQRGMNNFAYIPFSAGSRNCIGQKYAQFLMKTAIIKAVQKYQILPVPGFTVELGWHATLRPANGCYVILKKREDSPSSC